MLGDLLLGIDISLYLFYQVLRGYKRGKNANFQSPSKKSFKTVSYQREKWEKKLHYIALRILTGKKDHKIKFQRLRKIRTWTFGSLVHQINSF